MLRKPKRIYRAGTRYCRTEENPDIQNGIHGLMIINEPDVWMVNRLDKSARHIIDTGPTYNCRMPMFINGAEDMKKTLAELEFGRELDFFRPKSPTPNPGPVLLGKAYDGAQRNNWRLTAISVYGDGIGSPCLSGPKDREDPRNLLVRRISRASV